MHNEMKGVPSVGEGKEDDGDGEDSDDENDGADKDGDDKDTLKNDGDDKDDDKAAGKDATMNDGDSDDKDDGDANASKVSRSLGPSLEAARACTASTDALGPPLGALKKPSAHAIAPSVAAPSAAAAAIVAAAVAASKAPLSQLQHLRLYDPSWQHPMPLHHPSRHRACFWRCSCNLTPTPTNVIPYTISYDNDNDI